MIRRNTVALASSAVLGLSAFASPAAAACEQPMDVYVGSQFCSVTHRLCEGEAHWTECHNAGGTQVNGWVKDDKADGKCAVVRASFTNSATEYRQKACSAGKRADFHWSVPGAQDAQVYLFTE